MPDFREGQVENRAKTGKMFNFPGLSGAISPIYPEMVRTFPFHQPFHQLLTSPYPFIWAKSLILYVPLCVLN